MKSASSDNALKEFCCKEEQRNTENGRLMEKWGKKKNSFKWEKQQHICMFVDWWECNDPVNSKSNAIKEQGELLKYCILVTEELGSSSLVVYLE